MTQHERTEMPLMIPKVVLQAGSVNRYLLLTYSLVTKVLSSAIFSSAPFCENILDDPALKLIIFFYCVKVWRGTLSTIFRSKAN